MRPEKKLGHTNIKLESTYLYIMNLIRNDWKHILRNETSQTFLFKIVCYNNQSTGEIKDFQKLSNKEIYFIHQSDNTKYIKPFNFIL